ncbi:MAG: hypothetical protein V4530_06125 [Pseudomonadota bacterium]
MSVFSKDWDYRSGEKITAFKAGTEIPPERLEDAKAAGVVKGESREGAAKAGSAGAADKA